MREDTPLNDILIGLDLGDRRSHACVLRRSTGEVVTRFVVRTMAPAFQADFASYQGAHVVMEAGTHSPWSSRLLVGLGLRVTVANASQLALISRSHRKTDRTDAETLARLARGDLQLLRPIRHRSERSQVDLELLKARDALIHNRTRLVNHVRCAVKGVGQALPASSTGAFPENVLEEIPEQLREALNPLLAMIRLLTKSIRRFDAKIRALCQAYPATEQLQRIRGVGPITSLAYVLVLDNNPQQFRRSRDVGSYLGLCPRLAQSGDAQPQLRITKAGNGFLRRLLVQSAHYILGPFGEDCTLRRVGQRLASTGGKRGKKRAVIAIARKLAVMLHRIWATGEIYDPLRDAPPVTTLPAATSA